MSGKSETMRRMDAMRAAGLQPNMLVCIDTMTIRNSQTVLIRNEAWLKLYAENEDVRKAYNADVDLNDYFSTFDAVLNAQTPLIPSFKNDVTVDNYDAAKHGTVASEPIYTVTKEDFLPKKQLNAPAPELAPSPVLTEQTLVMVARGMAEELRDPKASPPDLHHMAWLLDRLADRIEEKELDITNLEDTDGDPDEHEA